MHSVNINPWRLCSHVAYSLIFRRIYFYHYYFVWLGVCGCLCKTDKNISSYIFYKKKKRIWNKLEFFFKPLIYPYPLPSPPTINESTNNLLLTDRSIFYGHYKKSNDTSLQLYISAEILRICRKNPNADFRINIFSFLH